MICSRRLLVGRPLLELPPWRKDIARDAAAFLPHPLKLDGIKLVKKARWAAVTGLRDPFFWQLVRLRARAIAPELRLREVAVLLQSAVRVALVDDAFVSAMARRLDVLICWSRGLPSTSEELTICCSALLRVGLDVRSLLFQDMLRVIARGFACPSAFQAALLASCLAQLRQADEVLLAGAEGAVRVSAKGCPGPQAVVQCCMVLHASAALLPQHRPKALEEVLLDVLGGSYMSDGSFRVQELQKSLLAILQSEFKWQDAQDQPSPLLRCAAEHLAGLPAAEPWTLSPAGLLAIAQTLSRWGHSCGPLAETAPRLLHALELKLRSAARPHSGKGLEPAVLLRCLGAALPFADRGRRSAQRIFRHLLERAAALRAGQLVALVELAALWQDSGMGQVGNEDDNEAHEEKKKQISSLGAELYRRSRELPLRSIPRSLAALIQLVPPDSWEADFLPLLRRCTGRLGYRLGELLEANATASQRSEEFDVDALGEVLYVCAAARYTDDSFLETSKRWILHDNAVDLKEMRRSVTAIHLLHSLSLLKAAKGDLLHRLVAEAQGRLEMFRAFEVLGFLDAAAILQSEYGKSSPSALTFDDIEQGPPPSGIGEEALLAVLMRLCALLSSLDDEELFTCMNLVGSMRLPNGFELSRIQDEAAKRGMLLEEKW